MANTVRLKRSAVQGKAPVVGDLALGELAINTYDGKLYTKKNDGSDSIVEIGAGGSSTLQDVTDNGSTTTNGITINSNISLNADGTASFDGDVHLNSVGSLELPTGTEAERPGTPAAGMFRFNSDSSSFEGYNGTSWSAVGDLTSSDVGTGAAQIPLNQHLGKQAFIDDVATLLPFSNTSAVPTNNGECIVIIDEATPQLTFKYRKQDGTVISGNLALS